MNCHPDRQLPVRSTISERHCSSRHKRTANISIGEIIVNKFSLLRFSLWIACCVSILSLSLFAQVENPLPVMPLPAHAVQGQGQFVIDGSFGITLEGYTEPRLKRAQQRFLDTFRARQAFHSGARHSSTSQVSSSKQPGPAIRSSNSVRMNPTTWRFPPIMCN